MAENNNAEESVQHSVLDGTDLILSVGGNALGFSTSCKVSTTTETGERTTKEASSGKWKEKYVKSFSEEISSDGVVLRNGDDDTPTYDQLKDLQLSGKAITASYALREGSTRTGKTASGYSGSFIITSLELTGDAGDDAKYSVKMENSGAVKKVGTGLTEDASANE
jgi:predicted secreted protein